MLDEQTFTPWAEPGWAAWNSYSPELDFCRFVGLLQRMVAPSVVLETGAGAGKITEQLDLKACTYLGFESDPEWRNDSYGETPIVEQMASADLVILDSDPAYRLPEIRMWADDGKPGSVCVIHDAGNGHGPEYAHTQIRAAIESTGLPGMFLRNPRGSWLGWRS